MSHFAKIEDRIVVQVIVAEQDVIDAGIFGNPSDWVQTSYNTYGGVHLQGGVPMRKNYAGIGYTYDYVRDAFIAPKQYASWVLNENTCQWESPKPYPEDNKSYAWSEDLIDWVEIK
jgi:hypothetical protein